MSAYICVVVLTVSALGSSTVASELLKRPTNVRLTSHNMNLVLKWDPPEGTTSDMVYTTMYRSSATDYRIGCSNISSFECDFTALKISQYGNYTGRVQALLGEESSNWVESNYITLDTDTVIGSPTVSLSSNGPTLEVTIQDPVLSILTLRDVYNGVTYNITYWKKGQNEKARSIANMQQNRVVLNDLGPRTKYCVQVQINTDKNRNPSQPSNITCESTANEQEAPWVAALVAFVIMAVAVALLVVVVVYWKSISQFLCPKDALPPHFESLLAHPKSNIYLQLSPAEEICHRCSIIAGDRTVEEGDPLEAAGSSCSQQPDVIVEER
uniref:Interleukin-10 receptor subunit beta-like n=1 Tax=Acanthochromis polyacanthus TaxID=80966 RepID=A0A3Q1FE44_9TELE